MVNDNIVGCLLLIPENDGIMIDEIHLESIYRNKGIGSSIIKDVLNKNDIVYLWVYKDNIKAISLYQRLGFKIIDEKGPRYYMKYSKDV